MGWSTYEKKERIRMLNDMKNCNNRDLMGWNFSVKKATIRYLTRRRARITKTKEKERKKDRKNCTKHL